MSDPDLRLARRAGGGDRRALARLYEAHKQRLMGYLVRLLGTRAMAEDVFQEVWIKVLHGIESYRPQKGRTFRAWLYRVAWNAAVDRLRYEGRRPAGIGSRADDADDLGEAERLPSPLPDPERQAEGKEMAKRLRRALGRLAERQRAAILLRHQQGMSYPEVAAALGVPQGTAKTLVHRGVLALRGILAPQRVEADQEGAVTEQSDE
jgi:RNA polymerase sigma-70 factor (ECF subfamily)